MNIKVLVISVISIFTLSAFVAGCSNKTSSYTVYRHLKTCLKEVTSARSEASGRLKAKLIDKCMKNRGHEAFSYASYCEENPKKCDALEDSKKTNPLFQS